MSHVVNLVALVLPLLGQVPDKAAVLQTVAERSGFRATARYDDVAAALKDERLAKDPLAALTTEQAARQPWVPRAFKPLTRNMLDLDPPDHTRLRTLVHRAFSPRSAWDTRARLHCWSWAGVRRSGRCSNIGPIPRCEVILSTSWVQVVSMRKY